MPSSWDLPGASSFTSRVCACYGWDFIEALASASLSLIAFETRVLCLLRRTATSNQR